MRLALFISCVLASCSSPSPNNGDAGPDASTDAASDGAGGDGGDEAGDAGGEYCPAGYTLTPFLTPIATTHTYTMADQVADPTKDYVAVLVTTAPGTLVWHFRQSTAPLATNSFIFLALHHYFDGIAFHRVVPNFVAQGGDPNTISGPRTTWGQGGPGYQFNDAADADPGLHGDDRFDGQQRPEHERISVLHRAREPIRSRRTTRSSATSPRGRRSCRSSRRAPTHRG